MSRRSKGSLHHREVNYRVSFEEEKRTYKQTRASTPELRSKSTTSGSTTSFRRFRWPWTYEGKREAVSSGWKGDERGVESEGDELGVATAADGHLRHCGLRGGVDEPYLIVWRSLGRYEQVVATNCCQWNLRGGGTRQGQRKRRKRGVARPQR